MSVSSWPLKTLLREAHTCNPESKTRAAQAMIIFRELKIESGRGPAFYCPVAILPFAVQREEYFGFGGISSRLYVWPRTVVKCSE